MLEESVSQLIILELLPNFYLSLVAQFHLYLRYFHLMDITTVNGHGAPTHIRKTRTIPEKEDSKSQVDGWEKHIIVLD
jgi:hypothetical protein